MEQVRAVPTSDRHPRSDLAISSPFYLTVDHGKSFDEMKAAGKYESEGNQQSEGITAELFPVSGSGVVNFLACYCHSTHHIAANEVLKKIRRTMISTPLKPEFRITALGIWSGAMAKHLFALGAKFPTEQNKFPIVALGQVAKMNGVESTLCLDANQVGRTPGNNGPRRVLKSVPLEGGFDPFFRFLLICELTPAWPE